jgi:lysophospholipase L1-like esterase
VVAVRRLSLLLSAIVAILFVAPATAQAAPAFPSSMAAAGDSITRGFDATFVPCLLSDCPQYSWSTGTSASVTSHSQRLRTASGHTVATANVARTGAKMADLAGQLAAVPASATYVTVLMGANDVCTSSYTTMTPTATFSSQFSTALSAFHTAHPTALVFVGSIPNVWQLWNTLHTNRSAASAWRTFGICPSMLAASGTDQTRQAVLNQEIADNAELARVCGAASSYCRYDNNAVFNFKFSAGQVSTVDYFHPSIAGQATLAGLTWTASYWG